MSDDRKPRFRVPFFAVVNGTRCRVYETTVEAESADEAVDLASARRPTVRFAMGRAEPIGGAL